MNADPIMACLSYTLAIARWGQLALSGVAALAAVYCALLLTARRGRVL